MSYSSSIFSHRFLFFYQLCALRLLPPLSHQYWSNGLEQPKSTEESKAEFLVADIHCRCLKLRVIVLVLNGWQSCVPSPSPAKLLGKEEARDKHHVNGNRMVEPFPEGTQMAIFGMGCFWGAERKFWRQKGVYSTHVGYAGGYTPNPTYKEVCSGSLSLLYCQAHWTGTKLILSKFSLQVELATWKLYEWYISQKTSALRNCSRSSGRIMTRHKVLTESGFGAITTEIREAPEFYYAEDYHQQYLSKNPNGYCGLGGTGISCPIGIRK
ncbi:mitochondrial peptide methionine sulfoxide reductase isoform X2 [Lagopus muta]|uniref:mitochondrial peptide methionine sulfoxide reductase isoform X2 n=1 Tax=Lagopus muta TaxID=64668 RepID=UPI00209CC576|nr:mitochondrial peptide methionine sulfoxide reductase isoform X2 [Lagopus muta]